MYILTALAAASLLFAAQSTPATPAITPSSIARVGGPTMTVGPNVLNVGSTATISYSDPSKAGQSITVEIDNGMRQSKKVQTVTIELDSSGRGTATWTVPDWFGANFNAPGVPELNRAIE